VTAAAAPRRRILYCEVCEDGSAGGSHQILFDAARLLDRARFEPVVVFYEENRFVEPLRALGIPVHVWSAERRAERAAYAGSPLRKLRGLAGAILRRRRLLARERIDLVHLNNSPMLGLDDWLPAAKSLGLPCVTSVMGQPYERPTRPHHRFLVGHYDRLVCISEHVREELLRGGYPPEQLAYVQVGIDVDAFVARAKRDPAELRRELGVADDVLLVALVGNLQPWKGHDGVVTALAGLEPAVRAQLRVLFVGAIRAEDRERVAGLEQRIRQAGLERVVSLLGSRADVPDLLRAADVQLHASTFPEPFGLVLVEGLALGKPVLAAKLGGPCEVLSPETGRLFDPREPDELAALLQELLADPDLRKRLGAAGPERARRFDAHHTAAALQRLYDELLGGARGPARAG
jgi:glycosyltransferase involved in cell wall biosynthesis